MKASAHLGRFQLVVSDKAQVQLAQELIRTIKQQARDGVQVSAARMGGSVMPRGSNGQRIDLVETGALFGEARANPLQVVWTVPYARYVIPKYAAGLSPRYKEIYNERAAKVLNKRGAARLVRV